MCNKDTDQSVFTTLEDFDTEFYCCSPRGGKEKIVFLTRKTFLNRVKHHFKSIPLVEELRTIKE